MTGLLSVPFCSVPFCSVLFSVCILCVFLLAGKILRVKVKIFQNIYLPASIIGGFVGVIYGPFILDILPGSVTSHCFLLL